MRESNRTLEEGKFLRDVMNMTTGWAMNGFKNQEEALREIYRMCESQLWSKEGMPG